ncbi:sigma-70 family RNA polymerase sigma factor [Bacillaceae bacterium]
MEKPDTLEATDLIRKTANGDREAFGELYEKTVRYVFQTVYFLLEEKADVEDVVQNIYLELYRSLPRYDPGRPFRPWLTGLVIRQVNAHRRKKWMLVRNLVHKRQQAETREPDFSDDVVEQMTRRELFQQMEKLPFKLKQVVILHYLHELTHDEVAQVLDIPPGTVKSRLHAALKKLRRQQGQKTYYLGKVEDQHEF